MSYTTLLAIYPGEKIETVQEFRNSHGSAPVVWNEMAIRYLGMEPYTYIHKGELIWSLYQHLEIPKSYRAVLMMTFDKAYILKKDYERAAEDIYAFLKEFSPQRDYVNHWLQFAKIFQSLPPYPAIGFHHTSVSENPFYGKWIEGKERDDGYYEIDWESAYDLYHVLDKVGN